ncbi:5'-3' exonuclease [Polyangium mundeleinium]|uniref:5'-3' exonuclease H3TH domain-containing protein n=1 Tax=Polyangium mundeleinium TaxID=2995306 RepID=A0ABT5ETB9_9BACT|nr:5'-3' exonuclease H3TH domain-containing protein [Polyangium mundeleinium]MDC0743981.1 5'-3' exonuclease H3TH domain-containing protein [Polyangium mundeleinium]
MRQAEPDRPRLHLVDATYELFRAYFAQPSRKAPDGREVGAVRGLLSTLMVLTRDATHIACATDHVVRSFRNDLYAGYKTGDGLPEELASQFGLAEDAMRALGLVVWPMVEFEADDAIAAAAARFSNEAGQVLIASVDKDLAQCVDGTRVVMLDRKNDNAVLDEDGVAKKFGVKPTSIPDFLALVGDSADGYPGLPGWGEKSAAAVLSVFGTIERIPREASAWGLKVRGAEKLAATLAAREEEARLFKQLATLRTDVPLTEGFADLVYRGAGPELRTLCAELGMPDLVKRVTRWRD